MSYPKLLHGSAEQEKIWKVWLDEDANMVIDSVAGSGKTYTGIEMCKRDKHSDIAYVAFNKHIQVELTKRISQPNVTCMTYHGLGFRALKGAVKNIDVDEHKLDRIVDKIVPIHMPDSRRAYITVRVRKLTSLAKQYAVNTMVELEKLVDHHSLDISGIENEVYDLTPEVLIACKEEKKLIDYDDMVWLPRELGIKMPRYDAMLIDEAQDTNMSQQWLALESADRLVVIGDPNQAIYGFRGSDVESMNRIRKELKKRKEGVVDMGLTYTRRCPKSHVELAQRIVSQIQALKAAPKGIVRMIAEQGADMEMKPGDLVLCRVNAELMSTAYSLIKRGVKAVVRGRDIGEGIVKLIDKSQQRSRSTSATACLQAAHDITMEQVNKYMALADGRGEKRAASARERYECLEVVAEDSKTVSEMIQRVNAIFADFSDDGKPNNAVVLGTVHRTKGLEANRVFVLRPDLIPHPMAKKQWEVQQERNLAYVAATRAVYNNKGDGELIWIGQPPSVFNDKEDEESTINSEQENEQ